MNGTGIEARFGETESMACDGAGNVYVADYSNNCIRRMTPSGFVSTVAGSPYSSGYTDGYGNAARFFHPIGVAVTPDGLTLYVTDYINYLIRRIAFKGGDPTNSANWYVTTICGVHGTTGGNYVAATPGNTATVDYPAGITIDSGGNLLFTETFGNRVRALTFQGGDPSLAQNWVCTLIAGDASSIDGASGNVDGSRVSARFHFPIAIAVGQNGKIYVSDNENYRIRTVTYDGTVGTLAGGVFGDGDSYGYVDGPGATARFLNLNQLVVDPSGMIYVCDRNLLVRAITPAGNVTTVAGTTVSGLKDGTGDVATFQGPEGLAESSSGTLYVGDTTVIREIEKINSQ